LAEIGSGEQHVTRLTLARSSLVGLKRHLIHSTRRSVGVCLLCSIGNLKFPLGKLTPLVRHGHQLRPPCRIIDRFRKFPALFSVFAIPFCSAHLASPIVP
jgi:hypothetical protein